MQHSRYVMGYAQNFMENTFEGGSQTVKFVTVLFSLESKKKTRTNCCALSRTIDDRIELVETRLASINWLWLQPTTLQHMQCHNDRIAKFLTIE